MSDALVDKPVPAAKKNIFDNEYVTGLVVEYKKNGDFKTYERICLCTNDLIDSIIRKRKFHMNAPFEDIKNFMFLQFRDWLAGFDPDKETRLYSYISASIKNAALSYVKRETALRNRMVFTDVPMEAFDQPIHGTTYHHAYDRELRDAVRDAVAEIHCRWHEPHIREAVRYCVYIVLHDRYDERRSQVVRSLSLGFDVDAETAKFILDWSSIAVRSAVLDQYDQPLGAIDLLRASAKFSFMPDIVAIIGMEPAMKLINVFAGKTVKFPSPTQVRRLSALKGVIEEIEQCPTPTKINEVAGRLRIMPDRLEEDFETILINVAAGITDDAPIYDLDHRPPVTDLDENQPYHT